MIVSGLVAIWSMMSYCNSYQVNPITGETQRLSMSLEQEIAMGRQAAPQMLARHGGLHPDANRQARVDRIGQEIVAKALGNLNPYPFEFHVLRDDRSVNAFALPGGLVFVTAGLLDRLTTDGQVAGVLAHEIGHVVERHSIERLAKAQLSQTLTGAIVIAAYDPEKPETKKAAQVVLAMGHLVNLKHVREDELESDRHGVQYMAKAGYDPRALLRVMEVLHAAGNGTNLEFFGTHPEPERRVEHIESAIAEMYPEQVLSTLRP